jgi:hypothetical protein
LVVFSFFPIDIGVVGGDGSAENMAGYLMWNPIWFANQVPNFTRTVRSSDLDLKQESSDSGPSAVTNRGHVEAPP